MKIEQKCFVLLLMLIRFPYSCSFRLNNLIRHSLNKKFSHYIPGRMSAEELKIPILFEDEHIVVFNKPSAMLSVRGRYRQRMPRHIEWEQALISSAACDIDSSLQNDINELVRRGNIPRKRPLFISAAKKLLRTNDANYVESMYDMISDVDNQMHKAPLESISPEKISVVDIAEKSNSNIFVVHRLDCETSGALIMAKSDDSAGELTRQFRDREVLYCTLLYLFSRSSCNV